MIEAIVGTIGSGKTMFLTWKAFINKINGSFLISNYHFTTMNYMPINNISDILDIKADNIYFAGDELWQEMDSRTGYSNVEKLRKLIKQMLQSRKKNINIGITLQHFSQMDRRIRNITSRIYYPEITVRMPDGRPLLMKVKYFDLIKPNKIMTMQVPLIVPGVYSIPEMYDTMEVVDEMEDTDLSDSLNKLVQKYSDKEYNTKGELKTMIWFEEKVKNNNQWLKDKDCGLIANWIDILRNK